ncbi:hypothetical protein SCOR_00780 [Sulfidibacter corallicola]|uniref:Uncharacterized protein n=1 Tax=Sulfidibacter corallicola TaxID=2818388 RepID=A0A8A4TJG1_SULCO|nr:hypothetical protein [Sulfidibacter corallicola]QTD48938.1 hypothetical protein J3U87_25420 [Sulfidibacter corallicola]
MKNNILALGACAILALIITLPLEWAILPGQKVTGLSGSISFELFTLSLKVPFWLAVVAGVVGVSLDLLNFMKVTRLSSPYSIILLLFAALCILAAIIVTLFAGNAKFAIGLFIAIFGVCLGFKFAFDCRTTATELID